MAKRDRTRATVGERIAAGVRATANVRTWLDGCGEKVLARRIDAAVKRAVREAWSHGREGIIASINGRPDLSLEERQFIETKYGVKL